MNYVDGVVAAVPDENKEKYIQYAKDLAVIFKEYGALSLVDTWADDVPEGEVTSFPMAAYSRANLPPIPRQSCHPFHLKAAT